MKHAYMIFPVLAVMTMSPKQVLAQDTQEAPKAVIVAEAPVATITVENKHQKYDDLVSKSKIEAETTFAFQDFANITKEINEKISAVKVDESSDHTVVTAQKARLEEIVKKIVGLEKSAKELKDKNEISADAFKANEESIESFKQQVEPLLVKLENNQKLVGDAATKAELEAEAMALSNLPASKAEEKKEDKTAEATTETASVQEKKDEKKAEACADDERYKVLNEKVGKMIEDQKLIVQSMLQMQQLNQMMMMNMLQQLQLSQLQAQLARNPVNSQALQYNAPFISPNQGQGNTYNFYGNGFGQPFGAVGQAWDQAQLQNSWMQPQVQLPQPLLLQQPRPVQFQTFQANQAGQFGAPQVGFQMNPQIQAGFAPQFTMN